MLSRDEIRYGKTFILKLWHVDGAALQWIEKLQGTVALHWYDIYLRSDWSALRNEASGVFRHPVSEVEAEAVRTSRHRCIYIHTTEVRANELVEVVTTGGQL